MAEGQIQSVQGVRTPALLIRVSFLKRTVSIDITGDAQKHRFDIRNTKIFWAGVHLSD